MSILDFIFPRGAAATASERLADIERRIKNRQTVTAKEHFEYKQAYGEGAAPLVFRIPTDRKIDLAVAAPLSDDMLRLTLVVGGKEEQFTISRGAAASLAGRIAEALK